MFIGLSLLKAMRGFIGLLVVNFKTSEDKVKMCTSWSEHQGYKNK